jgi:hypothetical protein
MKTTLKLLPPIDSLSGTSSFELEAETYEDVVSALKNLFPTAIRNVKNLFIVDGERTITSDLLKFPVRGDCLVVGPLITGSNVGMDSLGNLRILYGSNSTLSNQAVALTGLAKRVTDSSLFGKSQTAFDISQRRINRADATLEGTDDPTTGFGSLASTSKIGAPVPLHFGLVRTSGSVINTFIKHIQRGGVDSIRVEDYI